MKTPVAAYINTNTTDRATELTTVGNTQQQISNRYNTLILIDYWTINTVSIVSTALVSAADPKQYPKRQRCVGEEGSTDTD